MGKRLKEYTFGIRMGGFHTGKGYTKKEAFENAMDNFCFFRDENWIEYECDGYEYLEDEKENILDGQEKLNI